MADIFISYARTDRARAETLARALGEHGWAVWWDRDIPPGRTFDDVIEEALANATCVIVLWSRDSVQSEWVKTEASEAAKRRILVPILADEVKIPLEFRRIQSARLTDWENLPGNPDWPQLNQALSVLTGRTAQAEVSDTCQTRVRQAPGTTTAAPHPATSRPVMSRVVFGAIAGAILLIVIAGRLNWQQESRGAPAPRAIATGDATPAVTSPPPQPVDSASPIAAAPTEPVPAPIEKPRRRATATAPPSVAAVVPSVERAPDPLPAAAVERATVLPTIIKPAERSPARAVEPSTFEVMHARGVFRNQGRLSISPDGVRYEEIGAGAGSRVEFDVSCAEVKNIGRLNVIADREQRALELGLRARSYTFVAIHTAARENIVSAISRQCGPR